MSQNIILISTTLCIKIRAEKSDFWKSISGDLRQGDLNRFYPPCKVNAGSDVLDG